MRCDVCGRRLGFGELLRQLVKRERLTYPFRDLTGERREHVVRRLCPECARRGAHHRDARQDGEAPHG